MVEINEYIEFNDSLKDPELINQKEKDEYTLFNESLKNKPPLSYSEMPWGKTVQAGLLNLPEDMIRFYGDYIEGITQVINHPIITGRALKRLSVGALKDVAEKMPAEVAAYDPIFNQYSSELELLKNTEIKFDKQEDKDLQAWQEVKRELAANFGTEEAFKKMIAERPADVLATLAEIIIPAARLAKLPRLAKLAAKIDPIDLTAGIAKTAKNKILSKNVSTGLYRRSLKLDDTLPIKRKERILEVAKKNKLNIDLENIDKLSNQIGQIENIKDSATTIVSHFKKKLPISEIFKDLNAFEDSLLRVSSIGSDVRKNVDLFKKKILEANEMIDRKDLSIKEINAYKVQFGKDLDQFYDNIVKSTGEAPLLKQITANVNGTLKGIVEEAIPELRVMRFPKLSRKIIKKEFGKTISIKQLNQIEGDLIELRKTIQKQANNFSTGKMMDFQVGQKTATGAFAGSMVGTAIGGEAGQQAGLYIGGAIGLGLGSLDSSPTLKMSLANVLNSMRGAGIVVTPTAALIRMGLYEAGDYAKYRGDEEINLKEKFK